MWLSMYGKGAWIFPLLIEIIFQVIHCRGGQVQKVQVENRQSNLNVGGRIQLPSSPLSSSSNAQTRLNRCIISLFLYISYSLE
ncbi:hypothetical protein MtrunA17_Chr8g0339541 [Medicago truncatula]|uniref:Transmembrane protein n=1 Tax=Medicago truncatula TaxID=3880 RepID=A0A396GK60_MEDTR|nr:hypothetical protein MtrunA17_Chr8g0339541 [Medicago truncatula]